MPRLVAAGIWIPIVILSVAIGAALWFQWILTASDTPSEPVEIRDENRMTLLVGDDYPRLHVPRAERRHRTTQEPSQTRPEAPDPSKPQDPQSTPRQGKPKPRYEKLGPGDSIYALCKRLGIDTPLDEILALNGWTESDARKLLPGTRVRLQ